MRERRKQVAKVLCFIVLVCMTVTTLSTATVAKAAQVVKQTKVKVGFFESDGYHIMDNEGIMSGYGYDFLQMLLRYNDWEYEYVGYDKNWGDMLEMLDRGEIDMVTLADKTPQRLEKYDYSAEPVGTSSTIMTMCSDNTDIQSGDYQTYDGARIGLVEGSSHNEGFENYAKEKGFSYQAVYYSNIDELLNDLRSGNKIDIAVTSNMRQAKDEVILDEFDATDYYAVVKRGNQELLAGIDSAIKQMDVYSKGWRNTLFDKYYSSINTNAISLSIEEREYIQNLKDSGETLKAVMNPELKPYSYFEDGEAKGIAVEIFKEVAERLDIPYEILPATTRMEYKEQLNSGVADIDLTAYSDYSIAQKYNLEETDSYLTTSLAMLHTAKSDIKDENMTVATVKDPTEFYGFNNDLIYQYNYTEYDSLQDCIHAVKTGKEDVTFCYVYMAEQAVAKDYTNKLQYSILQNSTFGLSFGVINQEDHRLLAVLNKGVASVDKATTDQIMLEESALVSGNAGILAFAYSHPFLAMLIVALLLLAIFAAIAFAVRARNQKQKLLASYEQEKREAKQREALKVALDNAQKANDAKGVFVSKISHEIRTPLNAIIGYLNMAEEQMDVRPQVEHCIRNCKNASSHLLDLINDVLDLSAIENNKLQIAHSEFDFKEIITEICNVYHSQADQKKVNFKVSIRGLTEERMIGDSLRTKQIMMNLLSNAIKFTNPQGTVSFFVDQVMQSEEKTHIRFTVRDTGIGMEESYQNKLFSPFEQENANIAKKYGGSGLGLSITKNLVDLLNGSISVQSEKDVGTEFVVMLAFDRCKQPMIDPSNTFAGVRALIASPQKDSSDYMKSLLKRCGVKADVTNTEEKTIKRLQGRMGTDYAYDLCLVDDTEEGFDARNVCKQVSILDKERKIELVPITYDEGEIREAAQALGIRKIIEKPLFQSSMVDLLMDIYGREKKKKQQVISTDAIRGMHVLLAEDNEMNMEIAVHILTKAGVVITQARDGVEACKIFTEMPAGAYQAILMDIQMPRMDGYEATKTIRKSAHPDGKTIPIIALTANAFSEDVSKALNAGMNAHISKPVDDKKLYQVLTNIFTKEETEE